MIKKNMLSQFLHFRAFYSLSFALCLTLHWWCSGLVAQTNYTFQPAPATPEAGRLWQDPNNWLNPSVGDMFVPNAEFNEAANINNGATAVLTVSSPNSGVDSVVTPGVVNISNGGLEIRSTGALHSKIFASTNGTSTGNFSLGSAMPGLLAIDAGGSLVVDGELSLSDMATYRVGVTSSSSAGSLSVAGPANLAGALEVNFAGFTPSVGNSWTILEAGGLNGGFSSVTTNGDLAYNQAVVVGQQDLGGGRFGINALVQELLVLEVNRDTGQVKITQPGTSNISLDAYFIGSQGGLLSANGSDWNSLTEGGQLGNDWIETTQTTQNVAEFKIGADATIGGGTEIVLGNIYNPFAGTFGESFDDLEFGFRRSSDSAEFTGVVHYTGTTVNSLLLQVDPAGTGDALLRNTSNTSVQIDAYEILSSSGRLSEAGWNSLDEQDGPGNVWLEALDNDATLLAEFDSEGFTTIAPGASLNLGPLYLGGAQDLEFNFLMMGQENSTRGVVVYSAGPEGDFDGDGDVDGEDFLEWQRGNSPNPLSASDLMLWKDNYGSGSLAIATTAVPEPSSLLAAILLAVSLFFHRHMSLDSGSEHHILSAASS